MDQRGGWGRLALQSSYRATTLSIARGWAGTNASTGPQALAIHSTSLPEHLPVQRLTAHRELAQGLFVLACSAWPRRESGSSELDVARAHCTTLSSGPQGPCGTMGKKTEARAVLRLLYLYLELDRGLQSSKTQGAQKWIKDTLLTPKQKEYRLCGILGHCGGNSSLKRCRVKAVAKGQVVAGCTARGAEG